MSNIPLSKYKEELMKKLNGLKTRTGDPCVGVQLTQNPQFVRMSDKDMNTFTVFQKLNFEELVEFS